MKALLILAGVLAATAVGVPAKADDLSQMIDDIVTGALGPQTDAEKYCRNIADEAAQAKFEWQVKTIDELEAALATRVAELEKKRAEIETWIARREAFMRMAEDSLVGIYEKMRPDAAAAQLGQLPPTTAAALLLKLKPRTAGTILNDIAPEQAAMLTRIMIEAGRSDDSAADTGAGTAGG